MNQARCSQRVPDYRSALFSILALVAGTMPATAQPIVSVANSLERYSPTDTPPTGKYAAISAAKGETESFQIIITAPASGLTNVRVSSSDLTGPEGRIIAKSNLKLFREHYVYVREPVSTWQINRPLGTGWYPDGLIPFTDPVTGAPLSGAKLTAIPFNLAANRNQGIWIDVQVPRGIPAGYYDGTFSITSNQGSVNLPFTLTVWNFELPLKPSLKSSFNYWRSATSAAAYYSADTLRTNEELLRNRLMPATVNPGDQRNLIDKFGLNHSALPVWGGANEVNCTMTPPPSVAEFKAMAAQNQADLSLDVASADELVGCGSKIYPSVKAWARNLHGAGLPNRVVMPPVPELFDDGSGSGRSAVDTWVILPMQYDTSTSLVKQALQKGDTVWSYNTLMQDRYSPKWQVDYAPVNYRIQPGFINQSLGLSGLLYWRIDEWTADAWNDVQNIVIGGYWYRGEGMLVYPGADVGITGVAPSMRLKYLRDGVDDYDYVEILKKLGDGEWALNVARTVGPDWTNWTRDPYAIESARARMAKQIEYLMSGAQPAAITAPANGSVLSGVVAVAMKTHPLTTRVEFLVDQVLVGTSNAAPFSFNLDTKNLTKGSHTLTAVAYGDGGRKETATITFSIAGGVSLSIVSPTASATLSGTRTVTTDVSADVVRVEFTIDNVYRATAMAAPFSYSMDTKKLTNGAHLLTVVAYDKQWNMKIVSVPFNVRN